MKIERFDKQSAKAVQERAFALLRALEQEFGVKIEARGGTYDAAGGDFTMKVGFKLAAVGGVPAGKATWNMYCGQIGLRPEHWGWEFRYGAASYRIADIKLGCKDPVIAERSDGERFKFPDAFIRKELGAQYDWEKR